MWVFVLFPALNSDFLEIPPTGFGVALGVFGGLNLSRFR